MFSRLMLSASVWVIKNWLFNFQIFGFFHVSDIDIQLNLVMVGEHNSGDLNSLNLLRFISQPMVSHRGTHGGTNMNIKEHGLSRGMFHVNLKRMHILLLDGMFHTCHFQLVDGVI